jgi:hypothetical protein
VNVSELLRLLQAEHHETAARADSLREQIERLTTDLALAWGLSSLVTRPAEIPWILGHVTRPFFTLRDVE